MGTGRLLSLLLRVFFETADGGYYSPFIDTACFELLPIPEFIGRFKRLEIARRFSYFNIPCRCSECVLAKYIPTDYVLIGGSSYPANDVIAHWDPRFDIGVYADYWRNAGGRIPHNFRECRGDCYIFFAAGLAKYPKKFFSRARGFTEIRRTFMRVERGVYIVAYMRVDEVVDLTEVVSKYNLRLDEDDDKAWEVACKEYGERVCMIPHRARGMDLPVVMLSNDYGYLKKPIPVMVWINNSKRLTDYSYTFGVRGFEDRIRYKVFDSVQTREILELLEDEEAI